ncbi:MAG: acyltransferase family protein [Deltaproteobacteria bacterium]|nr:acyltransferase family protein [Deltaproteobacteria bacterium]
MNDEGKIHYLKRGPGESWEELARRLETRLSELEKELGHHPRKEKTPALKLLKTFWFGDENEPVEYDEFGRDINFVKKVKPLFDFLYYNYWRVRVQGVKNVPSEGRGLIVANHSGTLPYDGAMIGLAVHNDHPVRRDVRFLVEDFVYHFPFLGTFMYRIGGVRACQENAERLLRENHLVTVFPEGIKGIGKHFKNRYQLQRFGRAGFIKLALKTGSPLIPTAVIGAEEIHPMIYKSTILARPLGVPYLPVTPTLPLLGPLGLIPLPSKWSIYFGEPFDFHKTYGPDAVNDQLLINRLSEEVRQKIQEMVIEGLKQRRSTWFG